MQARGAALLVSVVALAGCMNGPLLTASDPVSVAVNVTPAPNVTTVGPRDSIVVNFPMPMDSAGCAARFTLHLADGTGPLVPGRMTFADGYRRMTFVPEAPLASGTLYFAHLRDSMMTRESMMTGTMTPGMMGGNGMMGGSHRMSGAPMVFDQPPAGAMRMPDGMGWSFSTR